MTRTPGELRDPLAGTGTPIAPQRRPEPGPIAILPEPRPAIVAAVEAAGGTVAPVGPDTRGVIWFKLWDANGLGELLREQPGIGWVQLPLAGVDGFAGVFGAYADSPRPLWTSTKGAYAEPVAEHALALVLACLRGLPEKARSVSWAKARTGETLFGRKVAIVGAGGLAVELIRLMSPFEPEVTIVRRTVGPVVGAARVVAAEDIDRVLADAEIVVLAAAATPETRGLIDARRLDLMRDDAVLVNVARGPLVDTLALDAALRAGKLRGAGIDVTDPEPLPDGHPLWSAPRCVITSHSADTDEQVERLLAARVRTNAAAFLGDGDFVGIVDPAAGY